MVPLNFVEVNIKLLLQTLVIFFCLLRKYLELMSALYHEQKIWSP